MRSVVTRRLAVVALAALTGAAVSASRLQGAPQQAFSSRVEHVRVDVFVTDGGRPVLGLQAEDFEVQDNGVAQRVELVTFEEIPLNVVMAFDVSGSVSDDHLAQLRDAASALTETLRPNDAAGVVTFNNRVRAPSAPSRDLSTVRDAFARLTPSSDTALHDASYTAMLLAESDDGRSLAVVFSDGRDTASFLRPDAVLSAAKRMDVVVYPVLLQGSRPDAFLGELADVTGGRVLQSRTADLPATFSAIFNEFRQRYLISYTPRGVSATGWHQLTVRLNGKRGTVRARRGYVAGA
jgi:VWFA-related protein